MVRSIPHIEGWVFATNPTDELFDLLVFAQRFEGMVAVSQFFFAEH